MSYIEKANELILLMTFKKHYQQIVIPEEFNQKENSDIRISINDHRILINGDLKLRDLLQIYEKIACYILDKNKEITFLTYGLGIQGKLENTSKKDQPVNIGKLLNVFPAITDRFSESEKTMIRNFDISFTSELNDDELFVSIRSGKKVISLFSALSHSVEKIKNKNDMEKLYKKTEKSFKNLVNQEEVEYDTY